jgi:hypothetical protein
MKNKKAAMEMSMGTIVTIVLLMSVLVMGIFFVQKIFGAGTNAVDLTEQQLQSEIGKLFSEDAKVVIYPSSRNIELEPGERGEIGIGIKNIATTAGAATTFNYMAVTDGNGCGLTDEQIENWIIIRKSGSIPVGIGDTGVVRIPFQSPEGTPNCLAGFKINVYRGEGTSDPYKSESFDVVIQS